MGASDVQINKGKVAVTYFHNHASVYPAYVDSSGGPVTIQEVYNSFAPAGTNPDIQIPIRLEGLGDTQDLLNLTDGQVKDAMESLADKAQGRIPSYTAFDQALGGKAGEINYVDLVATVSSDSAVQILAGAQSIGDAVISTGKYLEYVLPLAIVGAVLFIIYGKTKRLAA